MKVWAIGAVCAIFLSGCVAEDDLVLAEDAAALTADPLAAAGNATGELPLLGPAVDPWGERVEIQLFDGVVTVKECYGPDGQVFTTAFSLPYGQVSWGCVEYRLPDGVLIPEGTKFVRVEADASAAQHAGKWYPFVLTYGMRSYGDGWYDGEGTTEAVKTWRIPLKPHDWDPSHHAKSAATLGYWTAGDPVNLLSGPVKTKVVAERDPKWVPAAPLDHWNMKDQHRFPQEGVMTLLDTNRTWEEPSQVQYNAGARGSGNVTPQDLVPYGSKQLALALAWKDVQGCGTNGACGVRSPMLSGGRWTNLGDAAGYERGPNYRLVVYDVPGMAGEDGPYVKASSTFLYPWMDECLPGQADLECGPSNTNALKANVRFVLEAWQGDVDLASFKARLGLT